MVLGSTGAALAVSLVAVPAARIGLLAGCAVLAISIYQLGTTRMRKRLAILSEPFPPRWDQILTERIAFYTALSGEEKERFGTDFAPELSDEWERFLLLCAVHKHTVHINHHAVFADRR